MATKEQKTSYMMVETTFGKIDYPLFKNYSKKKKIKTGETPTEDKKVAKTKIQGKADQPSEKSRKLETVNQVVSPKKKSVPVKKESSKKKRIIEDDEEDSNTNNKKSKSKKSVYSSNDSNPEEKVIKTVAKKKSASKPIKKISPKREATPEDEY